MAKPGNVAGFSHHPTPEEERAIRELKRDADIRGRSRWQTHEAARFVDAAGLKSVSKHLETDFVQKVVELSKRFPSQRIEVLFEGSGLSRFPEELTREAKKLGVKVRVSRSDLYSKAFFKEMAAEHELDAGNYRSSTPEELVRVFGENRFHLVVSRSGGLNYSPLSPVKGIHNVCKVLKPGGEAHIITEEVDVPPLPSGREIRLKERHAREPTEVGRFFERNPQYAAEQVEHVIGAPYLRFHPILRIRRLH